MSVDLIRGPSSPALPRFLAPDVESPHTGPAQPEIELSGPGYEFISFGPGPVPAVVEVDHESPDRRGPGRAARAIDAVDLAATAAIGRVTAHRVRRAVYMAVPVLAVNTCAFLGQLGYFHTHLTAWGWGLPGQLLVAAALESIAVFLSYHAHIARIGDDPAFRLQMSAYSLALVIGALNYSHWASADWRPNPIAVTFALMSAVSPWLWGIHSRRESRDALKAHGLIEPHAVRLGSTRWTWHPYRSARTMFRATWEGTTNPAEAIAAHEAAKAAKEADKLPAIELDSAMLAALSPRERLVVAFGAVGAIDVPRALALLERYGCAPDQSHAYQIRKSLTAGKDGGS